MALPLPAGNERPPSADRVPTLTEVVELGHAPALASAALDEFTDLAAEPAAALPAAATLPAAAALRSADDTAALVDRVLAAVAPRVDEVVDTWLREALEPALARVAEALVLDARQTLAGTLRDAVQDAVQQTLAAAGPG